MTTPTTHRLLAAVTPTMEARTYKAANDAEMRTARRKALRLGGHVKMSSPLVEAPTP